MKKLISVVLAAAMLFCLCACGKSSDRLDSVNVYVLTGPTGIGAADLWNRSDKGETSVKYNFTAASAPDEIVAKISNGEADIAAVATNLAAKLYKKSDKGIKILAVNTLGVLSVLDNSGAEITSLKDLTGRKIVTTGQGANPQYIIEYLLKENGIDPEKDVSIEYKAEGSELQTVWAADPAAVIIAPAPVSTAITMKYEGSGKVLDLTDEWNKCADGSKLMMGCIIAREDFIKEHKDAADEFLSEYEKSINAVNGDPSAAGILCEQYGLAAKAALAAKSVPDCHLCFITGDDMKSGLGGYLQILYDADPSSVGEMPDDGFWYNK